ncbi:MarR family winged helix-turn-helix transcriptional regulator [Salinicoccus hispanicus]|uniref:MarR family transcriptional regulator n=1 Tax=Salinicoccus hispanicus TaxID=157225 RepID=A0A6N8U0A6_9STAP|nr:MarR family transcriptional regulator [Salinicoccus hispanicus]MXQ51203.1 MarR family transcriptional regulator [Salinicoccus hispanicus]
MKRKNDIVHNLRDIYGYGYTRVFNDVTDSVARLHISKTQMDIIQYIYLNGHATPSALALELNVQRSAVTHTVKKLERKKLVTVRQNELTQDKRSKLIFMTKEAETLLEEFMDNILSKIRADVSNLTTDEEKKLYEATLTILKYIPGGTQDETHS